MMDIIKFAIQMELDGKAFYEKGAATTDDPDLRKVFVALAEEEEKHLRIFRSMEEGNLSKAASTLGEGSPTPRVVRSIFREMTDAGVETLPGSNVRALWEQALALEEKAEKMYRDAAKEEPDPKRRKLLERIADEEKNHVYLADNMLAFVKDPSTFLDSAQYRSFMSWEGR